MNAGGDLLYGQQPDQGYLVTLCYPFSQSSRFFSSLYLIILEQEV